MDYGELTWDDVPDKFINHDDDACKCFSCSGWFPTEDCVINHDEEHKGVPVCDTCAEGRFLLTRSYKVIILNKARGNRAAPYQSRNNHE